MQRSNTHIDVNDSKNSGIEERLSFFIKKHFKETLPQEITAIRAVAYYKELTGLLLDSSDQKKIREHRREITASMGALAPKHRYFGTLLQEILDSEISDRRDPQERLDTENVGWTGESFFRLVAENGSLHAIFSIDQKSGQDQIAKRYEAFSHRYNNDDCVPGRQTPELPLPSTLENLCSILGIKADRPHVSTVREDKAPVRAKRSHKGNPVTVVANSPLNQDVLGPRSSLNEYFLDKLPKGDSFARGHVISVLKKISNEYLWGQSELIFSTNITVSGDVISLTFSPELTRVFIENGGADRSGDLCTPEGRVAENIHHIVVISLKY